MSDLTIDEVVAALKVALPEVEFTIEGVRGDYEKYSRYKMPFGVLVESFSNKAAQREKIDDSITGIPFASVDQSWSKTNKDTAEKVEQRPFNTRVAIFNMATKKMEEYSLPVALLPKDVGLKFPGPDGMGVIQKIGISVTEAKKKQGVYYKTIVDARTEAEIDVEKEILRAYFTYPEYLTELDCKNYRVLILYGTIGSVYLTNIFEGNKVVDTEKMWVEPKGGGSAPEQPCFTFSIGTKELRRPGKVALIARVNLTRQYFGHFNINMKEIVNLCKMATDAGSKADLERGIRNRKVFVVCTAQKWDHKTGATAIFANLRGSYIHQTDWKPPKIETPKEVAERMQKGEASKHEQKELISIAKRALMSGLMLYPNATVEELVEKGVFPTSAYEQLKENPAFPKYVDGIRAELMKSPEFKKKVDAGDVTKKLVPESKPGPEVKNSLEPVPEKPQIDTNNIPPEIYECIEKVQQGVAIMPDMYTAEDAVQQVGLYIEDLSDDLREKWSALVASNVIENLMVEFLESVSETDREGVEPPASDDIPGSASVITNAVLEDAIIDVLREKDDGAGVIVSELVKYIQKGIDGKVAPVEASRDDVDSALEVLAGRGSIDKISRGRYGLSAGT